MRRIVTVSIVATLLIASLGISAVSAAAPKTHGPQAAPKAPIAWMKVTPAVQGGRIHVVIGVRFCNQATAATFSAKLVKVSAIDGTSAPDITTGTFANNHGRSCIITGTIKVPANQPPGTYLVTVNLHRDGTTPTDWTLSKKTRVLARTTH
jgi:hypothetical protein